MKKLILFVLCCAAYGQQAVLFTGQPGAIPVNVSSGPGAGCTPAGSAGQILVDDGMGGCTATATGSGIVTWIGTPSGANLASALTTALPNTKGGTGGDSSAATGIAHVAAGTWSYSTIVNADVSASAAIVLSKLATQADQTIISNISGGAAVPAANTLTAILDDILGTTQGAIVYRNATVWTTLSPGSAGQFLETQGAGANPQWANGGGSAPTPPYITTSIGASPLTIAESTHHQGLYPNVVCFDSATDPAVAIACDWSVNPSNGNVVITYTEAPARILIFNTNSNGYGVKTVEVLVTQFATNTATGDGQFYYLIPSTLNGMNLVGVGAQVIGAGTTGTTDIQLARCAAASTGNACSGTVADMLSTKITVDSGENSSANAATPPVINTSNDDVATNQLIRVDVDAISTTPATGLIVWMNFQMP
jgi:hypothetical protein